MKLYPLLTAAALAAAVAIAGPAGAADPAPTFSGCGKFVKDSPSDATDTVADPAPDEVEIENAFVNTDATGATLNMTIKNLTGTVPPPATSITYDATYGGVAAGTTNFVRAYIDFAGQVVFEYGHTEPLGTTTRYARDGEAPGKLFTGAHGVVQVTIPADGGGKPGTTLSGMTAETQLGRTTVVPGAVSQSPSRGLSFQDDNAAIGSVKVGPCASAPAPSGGGGTATTPAPPSSTPTQQTAGPLPVKLVSKTVKRAKAKKTIKLKLKASEAVTGLAARISKGSTVIGSGKLSKLSGTGTVSVKLAKALKKGSYLLALAGRDAQGNARTTTFKLKAK